MTKPPPFHFLLLLGVLFASGSVSAQSQLVSAPVEGYFVAYEASSAAMSIREEIPEGETLDTWTSMITSQRFADVDVNALQFAEAVRDGIVASCPKLSMGRPSPQEHQGLPAASFSATCYRTEAEGGPETFFMMAVQADDAMLVRQVAFRADVTDENMRLAVKLLRSVVVCEKDCPALP